jgi:hypothetical protein
MIAALLNAGSAAERGLWSTPDKKNSSHDTSIARIRTIVVEGMLFDWQGSHSTFCFQHYG